MKQYPIGIQDFARIINGNMVYVDKTDLVYQLASTEGVYFLSRPRGFGKSLLVSTLKYYFQGRKDLFKGLKMEELEKDWKEYPVFEIDFNGKDYTQVGALEKTLEEYVSSWERIYGKSPSSFLSSRFIYVLRQAHLKTGQRCVVLIDECDKPVVDVMATGLKTVVSGNEMTLEKKNLQTLMTFYSNFKSADADLDFVFLTGVTKLPQEGPFSGFNNAQDISIDFDSDKLCGISQEELDNYFHDSIVDLAEANNMTFDETALLLKETYGGYHFNRKMKDIYNPFSLLNAFKNRKIRDYWFATDTPKYLVRLLNHGNQNIQEIINRRYRAQEFSDYWPTVDVAVPMIYQNGYLTIKGYDREINCYVLDLPNKEVRNGILSLESAK